MSGQKQEVQHGWSPQWTNGKQGRETGSEVALVPITKGLGSHAKACGAQPAGDREPWRLSGRADGDSCFGKLTLRDRDGLGLGT